MRKAIKRTLSAVVAAAMMTSAVPFTQLGLPQLDLSLIAHAASVVESGICGENDDNVTWTLDSDGVLTISGSGAMRNYRSSAPWDRERKSVSSVIINKGVTSIGDYAFNYCTSLKSIAIPDGVTYIGCNAFGGCSSLQSITIPEGVTSIGDSAFNHCTSLKSIAIPDGVTKILYSTFSGCSSLKRIKIPDGVTIIDRRAFNDCSSLESITIPDGVTNILDSTFSGCSSLKRIKIPDGVTFVGYEAFKCCSSLTSITLPDSVKYIYDRAFKNCINLKSIKIPNGVKRIDGYAFYGCSRLTSITIPVTVTSIAGSAFYGCSSLTSITIPDSVTRIEGYTFYGCSSLTSITIPDGVTFVGYEAFKCCSSLTSISIPDSVTPFGEGAFTFCPLTHIHIPTGKSASDYMGEGGLPNEESYYYPVDENGYCSAARCSLVNPSHEHIYDNTLSYNNDGHWNTCKVCKQGGFVNEADLQPHSFNKTVISPATEYSDEIARYYCTVCGYRTTDRVDGTMIEEEIDVCSHEYGEEYEWSASDISTHRQVCTKCGYEFLSSHIYGDFVTVVEPTETTAGTKKHTCKYCGYEETVSTASLAKDIYITEGEYRATVLDKGKNFHVSGGTLIVPVSGSFGDLEITGGKAVIDADRGRTSFSSITVSGGSNPLFGSIKEGGILEINSDTSTGNMTVSGYSTMNLSGAELTVHGRFNYTTGLNNECAVSGGTIVFDSNYLWFKQENTPFICDKNSKTIFKSNTVVTEENLSFSRNGVQFGLLWLDDNMVNSGAFDGVFTLKQVPLDIYKCGYNSRTGKYSATDRLSHLRKDYIEWGDTIVEKKRKLDTNASVTNYNIFSSLGITMNESTEADIYAQVSLWKSIITSELAGLKTKDYRKIGAEFKDVPVKYKNKSTKATFVFSYVNYLDRLAGNFSAITAAMNFSSIMCDVYIDGEILDTVTLSLDASTSQSEFAQACSDELNKAVKNELSSLVSQFAYSSFKYLNLNRPYLTRDGFEVGILGINLNDVINNTFDALTYIDEVKAAYDRANGYVEKSKKYTRYAVKLNTILLTKYQQNVDCPVDVFVYDGEGTLITSIENNEVTLSDDSVAVSIDGEAKFVGYDNPEYTVKIIGYEEGTMDYMATTFGDYINRTDSQVYRNIPVSTESTYVTQSPTENIEFGLLNEAGNVDVMTAEHSFEYIPAVSATCDTDGCYEHYFCEDCGTSFLVSDYIEEVYDSESLVIPASHSYPAEYEYDDDGHYLVCEVCGETTENETHSLCFDGTDSLVCRDCGYSVLLNSLVTYNDYSVALKDDIGISFNFDIDDSLLYDDSAYVQFTVNGVEGAPILLSTFEQTANGIAVVCGVAAAELSDEVTVQLKYGECVISEQTHSVVDYAERILANAEEYENEIPIVKALLNYGTQAQMYFEHNTDSPANSILEESDKALTAITPNMLAAHGVRVYDRDSEINFVGLVISLESNVTAKFYFSGEITPEMCKVDGSTIADEDLRKDEKGTCVVVRNIAPADYDKAFKVTVGGVTVSNASVFSYMYSALTGEHSELYDIVYAMYAYNKSAEAYAA